jgi:glucose-6-phosphate-specific signal transduction histidine kinase
MSDTKIALESLEGSETKEVLTKSSFPEGGVKGWLTVLSGLTNGLTYTPAVTAINQYFFQKRPIAMELHLADPPRQA